MAIGAVPVMDKGKVFLFHSGSRSRQRGSPLWKFDISKKIMEEISSGPREIQWQSVGHWARKEDIICWVGDSGAKLRYDIEKKVFM